MTTHITDEMMRAALDAYWNGKQGHISDIRAAIEAVAPMIAANVIERCAAVADDYGLYQYDEEYEAGCKEASIAIAATIRAMKEEG